MKKIFTLAVFAILACAFSTLAQTTATFENIELEANSYWNGSDNSGGFNSGNVFFPNVFTDWGGGSYSFAGFAVSNITDNTTPGYANQYSAIAGSGYDGSANYGLIYVMNPDTYAPDFGLGLRNAAHGGDVSGFYVTNSTWAAIAMQEGDASTKKFGGETGNDPDWFLLTIKGFLNGSQKESTVEFYLADYRFENNEDDYIITDWQWVDLLPLGKVDSLSFELSSTDNGAWGMNTPAYFCLDNMITLDNGPTAHIAGLAASILFNTFPNPASDFIAIESQMPMKSVALIDAQGRVIETVSGINARNQFMSLSHLPSALYLLMVELEDGSRQQQKILKK